MANGDDEDVDGYVLSCEETMKTTTRTENEENYYILESI